MSPDAPLTPPELRSNRTWILLLAGFSVLLLLGSIVFAVVRMPTMLAAQIREAKSVEVEIEAGGKKESRLLKAKESRDRLAAAIEASRFSVTAGSLPDAPKQRVVLRITASNRNSEVVLADDVMKAGFRFRASAPQSFSATVEKLPDEK